MLDNTTMIELMESKREEKQIEQGNIKHEMELLYNDYQAKHDRLEKKMNKLEEDEMYYEMMIEFANSNHGINENDKDEIQAELGYALEEVNRVWEYANELEERADRLESAIDNAYAIVEDME